MPRIAFVIPTIDRLGGAERQVILLAKGLTRRGWQVHVLALSGSGGASGTELACCGAHFASLRMRKGFADPRGWWRLNRWLVQHRPAIVHAHLPHATWMARWSRIFSPPHYVLIDTIHTAAAGSRGRRLGYLISDRLTDCVTAVSAAAAASHRAAGKVSEKQLLVLPNGIDVEHWRPDPAARTRQRSGLGEFLWLAAGRLEPVKDYPTLLHAFQRLHGNPQLVVAGAGSLQESLRMLATELGVEERVHFLGFVEDIRPWLQASDGFALSSTCEGLSMGLLESGACAVPAVVTDAPGNREIVMQGETGFVVAARDVDAFAGAMNRLMEMPAAERRSMGMRARQWVSKRYGLDSVLDCWESLYAALLSEESARGEGGRELARPGRAQERTAPPSTLSNPPSGMSSPR